jgi:hypothetical protein
MRRPFLLLLTVLLVGTACGGADTEVSATTSAELSDTTQSVDGELPPPGPEVFTGLARLVNLYVDGAGETIEVDVWAHRSFEYGPVLLAEGIGFAESSEYFATPETMSIIIVAAGAGPDAEEIGSMFSPSAGDQQTTLFIWDGESYGASSLLFREAAADPIPEIPEIPEPGEGLIILQANQLYAQAGEEMSRSSFYVGDATTGECLPQLVTPGAQDSILGGTQPTLHVLAAGTASFTLHSWPAAAGAEACSSQPAYGPFQVNVPDGGASWVFLYSVDGLATIELLEAPWGQ